MAFVITPMAVAQIVGLESAKLRETASLLPGSGSCAVPPVGSSPNTLRSGNRLAVSAVSLDSRADDSGRHRRAVIEPWDLDAKRTIT
jgi:hypothetical protein